MEILTWCDPKYFVFARALINSIRFHGNKNNIVVYLLDFNNDQYEHVKKIYENDSKITFKNISSKNKDNFLVIDNKTENPDVNNGKIQFYRNFRPRVFLEELNYSKSGKLCTFGANGLVFTNLKYIEDLLEDKDFVFMEREKKNIFTDYPEKVNCIEDIANLVKNQKINIDKILAQTTGKIVLLGTHAMRNSEATKTVLNKWINLIENTDAINTKFSDMNLFVKAYVESLLLDNIDIQKETGIKLHRDKNPFCDTKLISGNNIWFAKGPAKFTNQKYLKEVQRFINYDYKI